MDPAAAQLVPITSPDLVESFDFDPSADVEAWRLSIPAKGACYVLEDAGGRPVLLASCADLRHALVRRLRPQTPDDASARRIDYRSVLRRVRWRPVFGRFEADWAYSENARRLFPEGYRRLIRHWRAYWLCVTPEDPHPRFTVTDRPAGDPRHCFGPFGDAKAARRVLETVEDVFDLCRYHQILAQAPHGQACSYKQMGRCPAPCDGTVSMEEYRRQIHLAMAFLSEPWEWWAARTTAAMQTAAHEQRYEEAGRLKRQIERVRAVEAAPAARTAPLCDMRWIVLDRGDRAHSIRAFLAVPGRITGLGQIDARRRDGLLPRVASAAGAALDEPVGAPTDAASAERIGLVGWHLLNAGRGPGVFLHAREAADLGSLAAAVEAMERRRTPKAAQVFEVGSSSEAMTPVDP